MRTNRWKWIGFLALAMLTLLSGCKPAVGTESSAAASPTASPSVSPLPSPAVTASSTLSPLAQPFDNGGTDFAVAPGPAIDIAGQPPANQVDADYFADETAGWLLIELEKGKLALAHTRDGGSTWHNQDIAGERGRAVFFQDETHGYVMVSAACGTTDGVERCGQERLLYTEDGGDSWKEGWSSTDGKAPFTKADFAKLTGAAGYALTEQGTVIKTLDHGKAWKPLLVGTDAFRVEQMSFLSASTGWVVGRSEAAPAQGDANVSLQVWKTVDGGAHWTRQYEQKGAAFASSGIAFYDAKNGYFSVGDFDMMRGQLMRTTDGGAHWQAAGDLRPSRPSPMGIRLLSATEGWIPLTAGAGPIEGGLLHFTDGGANTGMIPGGFWNLMDAVPAGNGQGWALAYSHPGSGPAVLKTMDEGKSWSQVWPTPHPTADIYFFDDQHGYGIGRESEPGAFMQTDDGGATWQVVSDLGCAGYRMYFADKKHGWVLGTQEQGTKPRLMETQDGGASWRAAADSLPGWESLPQGTEMKFFNESDGLIIDQVASKLWVLRTKDGGKSWTSDTSMPDNNGIETFVIRSPQELLETSLEANPDKTTWLQLSRLTLGSGSKQSLGKWRVNGAPSGALYPSENVGAVITPIWRNGKMTVHLLRTLDSGRGWSDREFPAMANADLSYAARFGSYADTKWWLLVQGHLLRTNDAGEHWTFAY